MFGMSRETRSSKTGSSSQLCAVVMATTFGPRIVAEAKVILESRGSEEQLHELVAEAFDPLKDLISKGQLNRDDDLSKWYHDFI